jgi:hypothetical protein
MVIKKASGGDSPLRQVDYHLATAMDLASMTAAACSMFSRKLIGSLGFSHRGEYIGGRAMLGGGPGGLTTWWRGLGVGRATLWCGCPLAPLRLCFRLRLVLGKIGTSAFVSSNF